MLKILFIIIFTIILALVVECKKIKRDNEKAEGFREKLGIIKGGNVYVINIIKNLCINYFNFKYSIIYCMDD